MSPCDFSRAAHSSTRSCWETVIIRKREGQGPGSGVAIPGYGGYATPHARDQRSRGLRALLGVLEEVESAQSPERLRLCCEDLGRDIRAARVSVEGPRWLRVESLDGTADPQVCNPPPPPPPSLLERIRIGVPYAAARVVIGGVLVLMFSD